MIATLKKIGTFYAKAGKTGVVFALGFFAGVFFTGVLFGLYGNSLDARAMPAPMQALTPS
ncbi:hypothetical protein [Tsuneonella sp. HG222]